MATKASPIKSFFKKYIVDALSHMAFGLFCSLILGLIIGQIAKIPGLDFLGFIAEALSAKSPLVGACIGGAFGEFFIALIVCEVFRTYAVKRNDRLCNGRTVIGLGNVQNLQICRKFIGFKGKFVRRCDCSAYAGFVIYRFRRSRCRRL